jgi:hypothetical protein
MSLNVKLLRQVKKHILAEPTRLRMDTWVKKGKPGEFVTTLNPGYDEPMEFEFPTCGTVGCIAGWTVMLNNPDSITENQSVYMDDFARDILGIDDDLASFKLFFVDHWPIELMSEYYAAKSTDERAQIVGRVIDRYIHEYHKAENVYDAS